jgi:hypothetical protein
MYPGPNRARQISQKLKKWLLDHEAKYSGKAVQGKQLFEK